MIAGEAREEALSRLRDGDAGERATDVPPRVSPRAARRDPIVRRSASERTQHTAQVRLPCSDVELRSEIERGAHVVTPRRRGPSGELIDQMRWQCHTAAGLN